MPRNGFDGQLTLAAGANHLPTLLIAAGFTGPFGFTFAELHNRTGGSVYFGRRPDVDNTNGRIVEDAVVQTWRGQGKGTIDFNRMYVYSAAGGTIHFSCNVR